MSIASVGVKMAKVKPAIETQYDLYTGLVARAVEIFGSKLEAARWLSAPSVDFRNRTPLQAFTADGPEHPLTILGQIEHGIYS